MRYLLALFALLPAPVFALSPLPAPQLTFIVDAVYDRGETVTVRAKNTGSEELQVFRPTPCSPLFSLHDAGGDGIQTTTFQTCALMVGEPLTIAPGRTETLGTWDQKRASCPADECTWTQVEDGWYSVRASYTVGAAEVLYTTEAHFRIGAVNGFLTTVDDAQLRADGSMRLLHVAGRMTAGGNYLSTNASEVRVYDGPPIQCVRAPCHQPRVIAVTPVAGWNANLHGTSYSGAFALPVLEPGSYEVVVYGLDDDGTSVTRTVSFIVPEPGLYPDVPADYWAAPFIRMMHERGIMLGNNGSFRPSWNITRAEIAKVALIASSGSADGSLANLWPDLPETHTLKRYILTALAKGYLPPRPNMKCPINARCMGFAAPDAPATREEALKLLMDAFGHEAIIPHEPAFPDATSGEAAAYSSTAKEMGIVSGNDGRFHPDAPITRAEVTKIVANLLVQSGR